jgi:NADH-quinone oxidoreductase subunit N
MDAAMIAAVGDIAPELVILVGGVVTLLFALFSPRRWQAGSAAIAMVVLGIAGLLTVLDLQDPAGLTFAETYSVGGAALWGKLLIIGISMVSVSLSVEWFQTDPRHGEYYTILLFSALGAILLAGAADLMELILASVLSSATGFVLAGYHRRSKASGEAAIKYYLLGALTNGAMMYGIALLFGLTGSTTFAAMRASFAEGGSGWVAGVAVVLLVLGLAFKMASVPAHQWMPDVAEGAPAPAAAFLTVATKVGALLALARVAWILPEADIAWRPLIAVLAAATMTLGNLAALRQTDVRRLLGWSSVSQTGYGLMAIVALGRSDLAVPALLFFLLAYALANLAAFGVVVYLRGMTDRTDYSGLARTRPLITAALVLAFLSFIGIPPFAGFTAKLVLFAATVEAGYAWLALLAVANTVVSVAYYGRVMGPAFFADPAPRPASIGRIAAVATGLCAAGIVVAGLAAEPFLGWFASVTLLP